MISLPISPLKGLFQISIPQMDRECVLIFNKNLIVILYIFITICSLCTKLYLKFFILWPQLHSFKVSIATISSQCQVKTMEITLWCQNAIARNFYYYLWSPHLQYQIMMKSVSMFLWRWNYSVKLMTQWGQYKS